MQIAQIKEYSQIYSFEPSFVIWTQGCPLHCKGCNNMDTWDFKGGYTLSVNAILDSIKKQSDDVDCKIYCVTILGGEPLVQFDELMALLKGIKSLNLGVILYSGYEISEIKDMKKDGVFEYIDMLISGRFVESLRDTNLQMRGSSNQKIDFFTTRYSLDNMKEGNYFEIEIDDLGRISLFGYPDIFLDSKGNGNV